MQSASISPDQFKEPYWRLNNLYWIVDKDGRRTPFRMNEAQEELCRNLHGRDIILKARQRGITTAMCLISLDECLFNPNWRAAIIAHRLDDAKTIFDTKVKFPYDNLPDALREKLGSTKDSADALHFVNGSSVSVTTSARSGTLQRLHVSEFGKICAQYPNKAREIISGSFPAVERGSITIESTAEGQEGRFFEMTRKARDMVGKELGARDWRFHFFPWWDASEYVSDPALVTVSREDEAYFDRLKADNVVSLSPEQRAWWCLTEREQGGDMKREYPSTPDEAFEQAIEGAYFERQIAHATKHGHIGEFPYDPRYPVSTYWDLGRNDSTTIWLHQQVRSRNRFVGYYENSGEYVSHYIRWLREWGKEQSEGGVEWDTHYWPHDGDRQDLFLEQGRMKVVEDMSFKPRIVRRVKDKGQAIEAARNIFASCDFDEAGCWLGLKRLRHYRKEWDDQRGVWRDRPRHDDNSHGADGFMTFATSLKAERPERGPITVPELRRVG